MKIYTFLFISILIISCKREEKSFPMWNPSNSAVETWKKAALEKGDTLAYKELSVNFMDSNYEGFLYTSLMMANKYNFPLAYYDVYMSLTQNQKLIDLDKKTQEFAVKYLKEGAEKGSTECQSVLSELYEKGMIPK